jgi:predicted ATPase
VHHWGPEESSAEDAALWRDLWLETAYPRPQGGIWLRAESTLSFRSSLRLLALLQAMTAAGSQVLLATHSPVPAALPGAIVYELDGSGFTERRCALDLVRDLLDD